jgi:glucosyl-dolichyl phosphate glucuronosyltransferase
MKLDIVLPTYNRADLLAKTLDSLIAARRPPGLEVTVLVVDNNSTDSTAEAVRSYQSRLPNLHYIVERQQGSSAALNAGIRAGSSELIATLNDDEEVDVRWLEVIHEFFANATYDFLGGPYKPNWSQAKPEWVPQEFGAVIGWVEAGAERREYGPGFDAMLMGGNAVLRRRVFDEVGLYDTTLGRSAKGLACCEDEEMFGRILAANFRGMYVPDLIIYHYVPPERLTRSYHRRWCWWRGNSYGLLAQSRESGVPEIFGIPRWQIRRAMAGAWTAVKGWLGLAPVDEGFAGELRVWDLAGYITGKLFRRAERKPAPRMRPQPEHAL